MTHERSQIRILTRTVDVSGAVEVAGLRYRVPGRPRPSPGARVTVIVADDDIDAVLVRDTRTGGLYRAPCQSAPPARLGHLVAAYGCAEAAPAEEAPDAPCPGILAPA